MDCLAADTFTRGGLTPRDTQVAFARDVERILRHSATEENGKPDENRRHNAICGLIDASTGIGKTLGYLIPLLSYQKDTGKAVAISTFTRYQQQQVMLELELAKKIVGHSAKAAIRLGRHNFISPRKVAYWAAQLTDTPAEWKKFFAAAASWDDKTDPMETTFMVWPFHAMPPIGIEEAAFAIGPKEPHPWFERHAEAARTANVVITNHVTLLLHATYSSDMLGDIDAVIIDEADKLPTAAESILSRRIRVDQVVHEAVRDCHEFPNQEKAQKIAHEIQAILLSIGEDNHYEDLPILSLPKRFPEQVRTVRDHLIALQGILPEEYGYDLRDILEGLEKGLPIDLSFSGFLDVSCG